MLQRFRLDLRAPHLRRVGRAHPAAARALALPRSFQHGFNRAAMGCALALAMLAALPKVPGWINSDWQMAPQAVLRDAVAMQRLLSGRDLATYGEAIHAQNAQDWPTMDALLAQTKNPLLVPTLQAQRWLEGHGTPSEMQLQNWLDHNPDHPYARHMHTLARALFPARFMADATQARPGSGAFLALKLRPGSLASEPTLRYTDDNRALAALTPKERARVQAAIEEFQQRMNEDQRGRAFDAADRAAHGLAPLAQDMLRWQQANILFSYGDMGSALRFAAPAADRSGTIQPAMHWVAGMAAWQQELYMRARHHFHLMAQDARKLPAGDAAAAHFWAGRGWEMTGHHAESLVMLRHAASYGESFYAQLARQQLQQPAARSALSLREHTRLMAKGYLDHGWALRHPGALRAIAWQQLGQKSLARWELATLFDTESNDQDRAVLAHLAGVMNLPDMQLAMARQMRKPYGRLSSYPIPSWKPQTGFEVEQPLLLGIARQESGFDVSAISPTGASGLMQMMPQTANYVSRLAPPVAGLNAGAAAIRETSPLQAAARLGLNDPVTSLTLGQRYLKYLSAKPYVDRNLVLLIAAYNAGPKAAIGWSQRLENGATDPLAFIETLSYSETRAYVQHVLANSWTYHQLLGTAPDSLRLLARNDWPQLGNGRSWFAERAQRHPEWAQMPRPVAAPRQSASLDAPTAASSAPTYVGVSSGKPGEIPTGE